jgi:hypothetical protein
MRKKVFFASSKEPSLAEFGNLVTFFYIQSSFQGFQKINFAKIKK